MYRPTPHVPASSASPYARESRALCSRPAPSSSSAVAGAAAATAVALGMAVAVAAF